MILNQGQLSIVVSDWESYLGSVFYFLICELLSLLVACIALQSFTFVLLFIVLLATFKNKGMCAYHAAPWSGHFVTMMIVTKRKKQVMTSKELSVVLRDRLVLRQRCGEGYQTLLQH